MAQEQKKEMTQQEKDQRNTAFGCLFFLLLLALTSLAVYRFINDPRKKNYPSPTAAEEKAYYELWGSYTRCRAALEKAQSPEQRNKLRLESLADEELLKIYIREHGLFLPYLPRKDKTMAGKEEAVRKCFDFQVKVQYRVSKKLGEI